MANHPLRELTLARAREFFREPEAIFWVYVFPVLLAVGLGLAFRTRPPEILEVLVETQPSSGVAEGWSPSEVAGILEKDSRLRVELKTPEECQEDLMMARVDLVVRVGEKMEYLFDGNRSQGILSREYVDGDLQRARGRQDPLDSGDQFVSESGSRYIDFLIPGLIGMNILGGGIYGVGFVIVDMRVRKLLKRFFATPMKRRDFLLSIIGSRMLFLVPEIIFLLLVGCLGFGVPLRGGILPLSVVVLVSAVSFSGMGLLVASRARRLETVSGLVNAVMLPMWILSGIFFPAERFPDALQPVIQLLPLTAAIDALRAVMLEGSSLASQSGELLILTVWGVTTFALSLKWFRWI